MALRSSALTPQFRFDPAKGRYIDARGRTVSAQTVRGALDDYLAAKTAQVRELAEQLRRREVSIAQWQREMENALAKIHLASAAAAKGGWAQMDQSDYGRVGGLLRSEYRYLDGMARQIEKGLPLDGHFLQRADQYAQAGRHTFHVVETREQEALGMDEERSVRHASDSCWECVLQADLGWEKIKSRKIKQPGDRVCRRKCKCTKEYRRGEGALEADDPQEDDVTEVNKEQALRDLTAIHDRLGRIYPNLKTRWKGELDVVPKAKLRANGSKSWTCKISIATEQFADPARKVSSMIHESLHAFSPSTLDQYGRAKMWEESVIENVVKLHRPKIAREQGLSISDAQFEGRDYAHPYRHYSRAMERTRRALGELGRDEEAFYAEMLSLPADKIKGAILSKAEQLSAQQRDKFDRVFAVQTAVMDGKLKP